MRASSVAMKRKDYYTFRNTAEFDFVFITGLEFRGMMQPRSSVAYFQPAIAICHKNFARQFREIEEKAYPENKMHKEKWEPPNFLHLYGLRGRKKVMFGELKPLVEAAKDEFSSFLAQTVRFQSVIDPRSLLNYLCEVSGIYGPTGLAIEMFLQKFMLNEQGFRNEFSKRELPPYHQSIYQNILDDYNTHN